MSKPFQFPEIFATSEAKKTAEKAWRTQQRQINLRNLRESNEYRWFSALHKFSWFRPLIGAAALCAAGGTIFNAGQAYQDIKDYQHAALHDEQIQANIAFNKDASRGGHEAAAFLIGGLVFTLTPKRRSLEKRLAEIREQNHPAED